VIGRGYRNVMIEIANECNIHYESIIKSTRIHELIEWARAIGRALRPELPPPVGTSFVGRSIPSDNVIEVSDFLLLHGNGTDLAWLPEQIRLTRSRAVYRGQPVVCNEDDHFDFEKDANHMVYAVREGVSWGYFDPGISNYRDGYQCPPVQWGINTQLKRAFFAKLKDMTGV
jgi:hypothetical protein